MQLAAYLIGGSTLHTTFALPRKEYGQLIDLSADVANTIREEFIAAKLLIIDEISMVSSTMLARIDTRLRQIRGIKNDFGGLSVIIVADLYQLPPVDGPMVFNSPHINALSALADNKLFDEFEFFELTEIMRQKGNKLLIEVLNNLAKSEMTKEQVALLNTRRVEEKDVPENSIRFHHYNKYVDADNNEKIDKNCNELFESEATYSFNSKMFHKNTSS